MKKTGASGARRGMREENQTRIRPPRTNLPPPSIHIYVCLSSLTFSFPIRLSLLDASLFLWMPHSKQGKKARYVCPHIFVPK